MTDEKQRIAIATACGWTDCKSESEPVGISPINQHLPKATSFWGIPKYTSDLNAMHEAEKAKAVDKDAFIFYLCGVLAYSCPSVEALEACIFATAAQRAEAFLRALDLWKN